MGLVASLIWSKHVRLQAAFVPTGTPFFLEVQFHGPLSATYTDPKRGMALLLTSVGPLHKDGSSALRRSAFFFSQARRSSCFATRQSVTEAPACAGLFSFQHSASLIALCCMAKCESSSAVRRMYHLHFKDPSSPGGRPTSGT